MALEVHLRRAMRDGIAFHLTRNKVFLTRGDQDGCIPSRYLGQVHRL